MNRRKGKHICRLLILAVVFAISLPVRANEKKINIEYISQHEDGKLDVHFNSRLENGITKENTTISIDGVKMDEILKAWSDSDETMSYYVLTDISVDAGDNIVSVIKTTLKELLKDKKAGDTVCMIHEGDSQPLLYMEQEDDINEEIREIQKEANESDVFWKIRNFFDMDLKAGNIRKRLIVCTDGKGTDNSANYQPLLDSLDQYNIPIDVICITDPLAAQGMQGNMGMVPGFDPGAQIEDDVSEKLQEVADCSAGGYYYSLPLTGENDKENARKSISAPMRNRIDNSVSIIVDLRKNGTSGGEKRIEVAVQDDGKTYSCRKHVTLRNVQKKPVAWGVFVCLAVMLVVFLCLALIITKGKRRTKKPAELTFVPDRNQTVYFMIMSAYGTESKSLSNRNSIVIGRSPDADITIAYDPYISGRHCRLDWYQDRMRVTDLQSQNGTRVGGKLLRNTGCEVHKGDVLEIGNIQIRIDWR